MMITKDNKMPDFTSSRFKFNYLTALNLLSGMGVDLNRIYIKGVGIHENYRGEIRSQKPEPGATITPDTSITLEIGTQSAVDYMPYQFFYGLGGIRDTDRSWEDKARSFMAPFDAPVIRHKAAVRFNTLKYEFGIIDEQHLKRILKIFEFDSGDGWYDEDDIMLWISILPSLYMWGGNPGIVIGVLNRLFKYEFRLNENVRSTTEIPKALQYKLGVKTARLGNETVIGKSFEEYDSTYELVVSNIPVNEVRQFLPGGKLRERIERILNYCMPGYLDYRIRIEVNRGEVEAGNNGYLGYSSFI